MTTKTLLTTVFALVLSCNVMAQSSSQGRSGENGVSRAAQSARHVRPPRPARPVRPVQAVPELDGSMAFLALGLTFAVGGLIREKRRTR
jgi:hypothetical protein